MAQNTYTPPNPADFEWVDSTEHLTEGDFNADKVAELLDVALTLAGTPIGVAAYLGTALTDSVLEVGIPKPVTQQQIDDMVVLLNGVVTDPTRNDLSQAEQDAADSQIDFAAMNAEVQAALDDSGAALDQIAADRAAIPAATLADMKNIIDRDLNRQRRIIEIVVILIKAVRWVVKAYLNGS